MSSDNVTEPTTADEVSAGPVGEQLVDELVGRAKAEGLQLTGEGGLLQQLVRAEDRGQAAKTPVQGG